MAIAVESLAEQAWRLPERRINNGSTVTLRSEIDEESTDLSTSELTDLYCGVFELAGELGNGRNELARLWGYEFQRGEEPNTQTVTHRRLGEREVIGTVKIGNNGPFLPEIVLIEAKGGE
jgi:hypothetical protein